ncbi:hypothetical protein AtNW77_Chr3g0193781 [Arabidopsis thaliana]
MGGDGNLVDGVRRCFFSNVVLLLLLSIITIIFKILPAFLIPTTLTTTAI